MTCNVSDCGHCSLIRINAGLSGAGELQLLLVLRIWLSYVVSRIFEAVVLDMSASLHAILPVRAIYQNMSCFVRKQQMI